MPGNLTQKRGAACGTNFFIIIKHKNDLFIFLKASFYKSLECVQAHYIAGLHIDYAWTICNPILYIEWFRGNGSPGIYCVHMPNQHQAQAALTGLPSYQVVSISSGVVHS